MNNRVRQAVLKLMVLQEEYTSKELNEAVRFLSNNATDDVMELLRHKKGPRREKSGPTSTSSADRLSKVVQDLQTTDSDRYAILNEFETLIRRGAILPTLAEINKVGQALSKDFQSGKSRNESIPRLMGLLVGMQLEKMKETVANVSKQAQSAGENGNAYTRLAQFLIGDVPDGNGPRAD